MRTVLVTNENGVPPSKRAMITWVTRWDTAEIDGRWVGEAALHPGQAVEAVNHFGRHVTRIGDVIALRDIQKRVLATVQVSAIQLVEGAALTDEDIQDLGYDDRESFLADHGKSLQGRGWLMPFERVTVRAGGEPAAKM